jgi:hypothetical protein
MKTSPEASPPASPDSHRKRLELNRLAAFKSRQKKKIESEQLRLQLLQLSQTLAALSFPLFFSIQAPLYIDNYT